MRTNWEDYYQVQPMDSAVTPSQQRPQTRPTPRDSCTTRTTIKPQALPQEKNVQLGECIQIILWPMDKTVEAKKKNKSSNS